MSFYSSQSSLQKIRAGFLPRLPLLFDYFNNLEITKGIPKFPQHDIETFKSLFPKTLGQPVVHFVKGEGLVKHAPIKVGVLFSGGQAPGGHNVIIGVYEALKSLNERSLLLGFLNGPQGLLDNKYKELHVDLLNLYKNSGGFDLLGTGRTKIESQEQLSCALQTCLFHKLDGLVIIGGDDSNTNGAILAEYLLSAGCKTKVIGVPKTIDGDLKNEYIETPFGFDTACKIYSEMIGNLCRDALSSKKYYHFIKLMGRSASHIALECALKTQPNLTFISEEILSQKKTLNQIIDEIVDLIIARADSGKNYGVILIPEGLIEFIPEIRQLIFELNQLFAKHSNEIESLAVSQDRKEFILQHLSSDGQKTLNSFPEAFANQLLLDRDPHGNIQVSQITTENMLISAVKKALAVAATQKKYKAKFNAISHFFGYEGRCGFPSFFDATYCYTLGVTAALLITHGLTGYIACVQHLSEEVGFWEPCGFPITAMMGIQERKGKQVPVIQKALVDLKKLPFTFFAKARENWAIEDHYLYPGPIQFFGPKEIVESTTFTLLAEREKVEKF